MIRTVLRFLLEVCLRGSVILAGVLGLLAAGEIYFRPAGATIRPVTAGLSALAGLLILLLQHLYFSQKDRARADRKRACDAEDELQGSLAQIRAMEHRRKCLLQQVESLTAHRNLSHVASTYQDLDDFMDNVARLARDNAGARSLTLFLREHEQEPMYLHAYYHLSETVEMCLHFDAAGGALLGDEMARYAPRIGVLDANHFHIRKLNYVPVGHHMTINGELTYRGTAAGRFRLALLHIDPAGEPAREMLRTLTLAEICKSRIHNGGLVQTDGDRPYTHVDSKAREIESGCLLDLDGQSLGLVKMGFHYTAGEALDDAIRERFSILRTAALHIARVLHNERIYDQAIRDGMTKLFNKRHMMNQTHNMLHLAARHGTHLSLILIDIDHFKSVNDTYGHLTGDLILCGVSAIMLDSIRDCDMAFRYGGEELAILLPQGCLHGTVQLAERIRQRIEAEVFTAESGETLHITASFGVAEFRQNMEQVQDLISQADKALYQAKEGGRNQVVAIAAESPRASARHAARRPIPPRRKTHTRI